MIGNNGYIGRNPGDASVIIARQVFRPTGIQTSFTFAAGYERPYLEVYLNGAKQVDTLDYTAPDGRVFNLTVPAVNGDIVEAIAYEAFNLAQVSSSGGNFVVGGDLIVNGETTLNSGVSTTFVSAVVVKSDGNQVGNGVTTLDFIGSGTTLVATGSTVTISVDSTGIGTAIKYTNGQKSPFSYIDASVTITEDVLLDTTTAGESPSYIVVQEPRMIVQTGAAVTVGLGKTLVTDLYQLGEL